MKTRSRRPTEHLEQEKAASFPELDDRFSLEHLSEEELEELLFDEEESGESSTGMFNLPTMAGLSLIVVGIVYMFQQLGFFEGVLDISTVVNTLPWLAGVLIILLGFGVLSWRPKKKKKVRKAVDAQTGKEKVVVEAKSKKSKKKRLQKTRDKRLAGVCGGIAEYFNIDPTLVRIAFVIGTIASGGPFVIAYILLAMIMPKPEPRSEEERITIIRDS